MGTAPSPMGSVQEEPPAATATPLHRDAIDGLCIWCWGRACTLVRGGSGSLRCEAMRVPDMRDMHIRTARPRKAKAAAAEATAEQLRTQRGKDVAEDAAAAANQRKRYKDAYNRSNF